MIRAVGGEAFSWCLRQTARSRDLSGGLFGFVAGLLLLYVASLIVLVGAGLTRRLNKAWRPGLTALGVARFQVWMITRSLEPVGPPSAASTTGRHDGSDDVGSRNKQGMISCSYGFSV